MGYKLKLAGLSVVVALLASGVTAGIHHARELNHQREVAEYTRWYNCHEHPTPDCPKPDPDNPLNHIQPIDPLAIPKPATPRPADNRAGPLPPAEYFGDNSGRPR